jgi:hypothetical protein
MVGETQWQSVYYQDDQKSIVVNMPTEPAFIFKKGDCLITSYSGLDKPKYVVAIGKSSERSVEEVIASIDRGKNAQITRFEPSPSSIIFYVEVCNPDGRHPAIVRIYVTSPHIYCVMVEEKDWSSADEFFNSFKFEEQ